MTASSFDVVTGCFLLFFLFVSINIFKFFCLLRVHTVPQKGFKNLILCSKTSVIYLFVLVSFLFVDLLYIWLKLCSEESSG